MDGNNVQNGSGSCNCSCGGCKGGMCGTGMIGGLCHGVGHHFLLRIIIGLAILAIVFKMGAELGEFKAEFMGGHNYRYGNSQMMQGNNYGYNNMMGGAAYDSLDNIGYGY